MPTEAHIVNRQPDVAAQSPLPQIIHSGFTAFVHRHAARWTDDGVDGGNGSDGRDCLTDGSKIHRCTEFFSLDQGLRIKAARPAYVTVLDEI